MKKILISFFALLCCTNVFTQSSTLKGRVSNDVGEGLPGVSIVIKGATTGTTTDDYGNFLLTSAEALPFTIVFTSTGYHPHEVRVKGWSNVTATLSPKIYVQEMTVSTTKAPIKTLSAPVSYERMSLKNIQTTPAVTPYDAIAYFKGVDVVASGLLFKTPSTRGFNGSGSARVNQWVDGMDNQAPGMNFAIGNFAGITELDLESIEVLPGASSALYGPGGMNGMILLNSKSPFKFPGLSIQVKEGAMNIDKSQRPGITGFHDWSFRYAKIIGKKFAFKVAAQYIKATDWLARDSSNYLRDKGQVISGTRNSDPNYDGVNVYGDETSVNIYPFIPLPIRPPFPSPIFVSRTGYDEKDVIDPVTKNLKLSTALHYKLSTNTEAILAGNWGTGTTVYTGSDRYALKNVKIGQYKLEIRNKNWFIRGYTTQEDAGDSYAATIITRQFNESWKPSGTWYQQYLGTYVPAFFASDNATAHALARAEADKGRPAPGSQRFNQIMDSLKTIPISKGGGLFLDKSNLYMAEAQYNLGKLIPFAEVIVGGNYKKYELNSQGTIFIDTAGKIGVNEVGGYLQATKKLLKDRLTLAASGRIDKNQNFAGKLTPRFSALVKIAENNNLRFSYQTAYRFPTTQQQFIKLQVGTNTYLLGGLPWIKDYMHSNDQPVVQITETGMQPYAYKELTPETSNAFEVGYKGFLKDKWLVDVYGYVSRFENFLGRINLYQPATQKIYSIVTNSDKQVKTHGYGVSINYLMNADLTASANFYSDKITDVPDGFVASFNTPAYRFNAGLSSAGMGKQKKLGFGIQYRWQDAFMFENDFANGNVNAFSTLDAQVSYKILNNKCQLRVGGTNLLNHYYKTAFGNPEMGGLYYAAVRLDIQ